MANVWPIEALDPSGHWWREERILDADSLTWTHHWHAASLEWTGYLVVVFPPTHSDKLRLIMRFPYVGENWQLDIHRGGQWVNLVDRHHPKGATSGPVSFLPGWVDAVRFRMKADASAYRFGGPSWLYLEDACGGPLAPICKFLHQVGEFFIDLASDIRELWLIGEYLATPFENLGEFFQDGAVTCCTVSGALQDILDALEGGITPESLLALIEDSWPGLYAFITDPVAYITEIVSDLIPDLPDWLDDPVAYITEIVSDLLPDLPDWLDDPVAWLAAMFEEHFPLLYYLIVDPGGWLLYIVGEAFGLEPYEAQAWDFVLKALFERYFPELYLLWRELQLWLGLYEREGAVGVMSEIQRRFYRSAEQAIRFLWEGEW